MLKTKTVKINSNDRDNGMVFLITELPLIQADDLMMRYARACSIAGFDFYALDRNVGAEGLKFINAKISSSISIEDQKEINAILDGCIKVVPSGGEAREFVMGSDIQELKTLHMLRHEALYIHTDFLNKDESQNLSKDQE